MLNKFKLSIIIVMVIGSISPFMNAQTKNKVKHRVALHEYCPVAYKAMDKALKGKSEYSSTYEGKTYYFVNAKAKSMFDKMPEKFIPKYDGYCATAMSMGKKLESNPKLFTEYKGNTYLFSTKKAKVMFDKNPKMISEKADKQFKAMKQ